MTPTAHKVILYMFTGSVPSLTVQLMLEHKGLRYKRVHVMCGPHAFTMLARGFDTMTVPALKIDGRRVQGSRTISRALDELVSEPPLFAAGPQRRRAIEVAERAGEGLQNTTRRIFWCAVQRDPAVFHAALRHASPLMRPAQRLSRPLVTRLASAAHWAIDDAGQEDVAGLPAQLDRIDAWIAQGLLDGAELNAADFQIAPNVALLRCFEDLAALIEGRPAAALAERVVPPSAVRIPAVLPAPWLTSAPPL